MSGPLNLTAEGHVDEFIEATPVYNNWLWIYWPKNAAGRLSKELVKRFKMIEAQIPGAGFRGWICNSEREHGEMHKIIQRLGGQPYSEDADLIFFKKEIAHV